jgi:hypothetical protein
MTQWQVTIYSRLITFDDVRPYAISNWYPRKSSVCIGAMNNAGSILISFRYSVHNAAARKRTVTAAYFQKKMLAFDRN